MTNHFQLPKGITITQPMVTRPGFNVLKVGSHIYRNHVTYQDHQGRIIVLAQNTINAAGFIPHLPTQILPNYVDMTLWEATKQINHRYLPVPIRSAL